MAPFARYLRLSYDSVILDITIGGRNEGFDGGYYVIFMRNVTTK